MQTFELLLVNKANKEKLLLEAFIEGNLKSFTHVDSLVQDIRDKFIMVKGKFHVEFRIIEDGVSDGNAETVFKIKDVLLFVEQGSGTKESIRRSVKVLKTIDYEI
jgi:hypothetical protein